MAEGADRIRGTVRNVHEEAVEGAVVSLVGNEYTVQSRDDLVEEKRVVSTDPQGTFGLVWPEAATGEHVLTVRHAEYVAYTIKLTTPPERPLDIVLEEGHELCGDVMLLDKKTFATGVRVVARGVGAPYAGVRVDRLPPAAAAFQETRTDERGAFSLRGLPPGWYQVDVVAPGLAVIPGATAAVAGRSELALLGPRGVVARTGEGPVHVCVAAIGCLAVRVVDAAKGFAVPRTSTTFLPPSGCEFFARTVGMVNSDVMLINGRTYSTDKADLAEGTEARFVLSRSYPMAPSSVCKIKVFASGYDPSETDIAVTVLGTTDAIPVQDVKMNPRGRIGGVRFRLRDRNGIAVQHVFALVLEEVGKPSVNQAVRIRFDSLGNAEPLALPVGDYQVRAACEPGRSPVEPAAITVSESTLADVTLVLKDVGGFALTVVDEHGVPLDDFGVTTSVGHEPIQQTAGPEGRAYVIRGVPTLVPGLGAAWRGQDVGYREGPVTIEVARHGYRLCRIFTEARAGEIRSVTAELKADPDSSWPWR